MNIQSVCVISYCAGREEEVCTLVRRREFFETISYKLGFCMSKTTCKPATVTNGQCGVDHRTWEFSPLNPPTVIVANFPPLPKMAQRWRAVLCVSMYYVLFL